MGDLRAARPARWWPWLAVFAWAAWPALILLAPVRGIPAAAWASFGDASDAGCAAGPIVVVVADEGNQSAAAWAAAEVRHWPLVRGRVVFLRGEAAAPAEAQWIVDLREGTGFQAIDPESAGSRLSTSGGSQAQAAAAAMLGAVNATIDDTRKSFVLVPKPCLVDTLGATTNLRSVPGLSSSAGNTVGRANRGTRHLMSVGALDAEARITSSVAKAPRGYPVPFSSRPSGAWCPNWDSPHLIVAATTSDDQPLALRIRQHRIMLHALLRHLEMIDQRVSIDSVADPAADGDPVRLAVYAGPGTRKGMQHLLGEMQRLPQATVLPLGPEEINAGALAHFNVILFPGGSGTRQGESLGQIDRQRVREFIQRGGGYVGICAGAYLATAEWPCSLKILDAKNYSRQWKRGQGLVRMELTSKGREILGTDQILCEVRYHNGPILVPARRGDLPEYQPLAVFRRWAARNS
ncbi:MAG: BPL-N domain-containing protein [Thermoguttaceae bacterium]